MSDYIKREDATAVISKTLGSLGNSVITEINSLSGFVSDRPTGGWVIEDAHTEHCSACGYAFHTSALFAVGGNDEPNFCPNCGAKMEGGEEE